MFTTRNVVCGVVAIAVLSLGWGCWILLSPLDNGGLGSDSYGTRRHGQRAIFDILIDLKIRVDRGLAPPDGRIDQNATLVFWKPNSGLMIQEPRYLKLVGDWLHQGGRVVIAMDEPAETVDSMFSMTDASSAPATLFVALGVAEIDVFKIDLSAKSPPPERRNRVKQLGKIKWTMPSEKRKKDPTVEDDLQHVFNIVSGELSNQPTQSMSVLAAGSLTRSGSDVKTIDVPTNLQVLDLGNSQPDGQIDGIDPWGEKRTLAAAFRVGQGELVVLSTGSIGENRLISQNDNSVLVTQLITPSGQPVVLDEFYHGLTVRGNPLWLFTRPGFGLLSICLLAVVGLLTWRKAIYLGPPLKVFVPSRRSIGEYVAAMGVFLKQGKAARAFVLRESRNGVLHAVRKELGLPPGRDQVEELVAVLKRRNPARAGRLVDAVQQIDQALSQNAVLRESEAIRLLQGISSCL